MLQLHRMIWPFEFRKDTTTGQVICPGDFYYTDDEDPDFCMNAKTYDNLKKTKKRNEWDYTTLNLHQSQKEYEKALRDAQYQALQADVLNRKVYDKFSQNNDREAGEY